MDNANYDFKNREKYWQKFWADYGVYRFDPDSKKPLFTVDTPPPTISGALHLGHVFSYTQAEVVVRFFRMAGANVRYPFCLDNNGLPTERLVEKEKGVLARDLPLEKFTKLCFEVIEKYKKSFENLFTSLGFSFDLSLTYSTISPQVQQFVQTIFVKLYNRGLIYRKASPALYCPECQTSVAQAEVEDRQIDSVFYDIAFKKENGQELIISTTRPELIPACVAVFVNPTDARYKKLVGSGILTPFGDKVNILADEKVEKDKGTGAVMCCTYGDETDVYWVKTHNLPEKIILDSVGLFTDEALPEILGKPALEGRQIIVEKLKNDGKIKAEKKIVHDVGVHERCGTPIEIINRPQWFIKILDYKKKLLRLGEKINWSPAYMKKRYIDWVENLKWDWSISRERFFAIPIPVYICQNCGQIILARESEFPVDPRLKKFSGNCPNCKSQKVLGETNVLDTWFTSSLTPDINNNLPANGRLKGKMYPMTMRPQAHDIIRTWVLYSIAMGYFNHRQIPWGNLMISGHILLRKGQKISKKTGGGQYSPEELIDKYSADAVRFAMCSANLGQNAHFDEGEVEQGKKLITKILNAAKFTLGHILDFKSKTNFNIKNLEASDIWILGQSQKTAEKMADEFKKYEIGKARQIFEDFFWNDFCDNYLEIIKGRLYQGKVTKRQSAQFTLYHSFLGILKMLAPFMPHITEEIYQMDNYFVRYCDSKSVHLTLWPKELLKIDREIEQGARLMLEIISQVRKYKSDKKIGLGTKISRVGVFCAGDKKIALEPFLEDIKSTTRAEEIIFSSKEKEQSNVELFIRLYRSLTLTSDD